MVAFPPAGWGSCQLMNVKAWDEYPTVPPASLHVHFIHSCFSMALSKYKLSFSTLVFMSPITISSLWCDAAFISACSCPIISSLFQWLAHSTGLLSNSHAFSIWLWVVSWLLTSFHSTRHFYIPLFRMLATLLLCQFYSLSEYRSVSPLCQLYPEPAWSHTGYAHPRILFCSFTWCSGLSSLC